MSRKRVLFLILCVTALCILLTVPLLLRPAPAPEPIDTHQAVTRAIDFLKDTDVPDALLMLNVMHRRFGIAEFADALQRYDQILAEAPPEAPVMRLFRRIAVHENFIEATDLDAVTFDVDFLTIPALYCDRLGLPGDYVLQLTRAASSGEYMLTHALLAWIWIQENGFKLQLPKGFVEDLYRANAELIDDNAVVTDLELEAAAFLYLAGQGTLVDDAFVKRVIAVQNTDGGWLNASDAPEDASHWHPTVVGLLLLLHVEYPADSYPPMLAPEPL